MTGALRGPLAKDIKLSDLGLVWGEPKSAGNGEFIVRSAPPTESFWAAYRGNKDVFQAAGVRVQKKGEAWVVVKFERPSVGELTRRAEQRELSRAANGAREFPMSAAAKARGFTRFPYQNVGISIGLEKDAVLIGDSMGLGKSLQAIGIIDFSGAQNALIIVPASLKLNWERELNLWLTRPMTVGVIKPGAKRWPDAQIVIINYDLLAKYDAEIKGKVWDALVIDEAHYLKGGSKVKRGRYVFGNRHHGTKPIRAKRKVLLTGTPIANRPVEIWPLIHYLDPVSWSSFPAFATRYCLPGDAPITMADLSVKKISDVAVGDKVLGWDRGDRHQRRLVEATVLDVPRRRGTLQRVCLEDGTKITCTPDHRWLNPGTMPGVPYEFQEARTGPNGKPGISGASKIAKIVGPSEPLYIDDPGYRDGYVLGFFMGDGYCSKHEKISTSPFRGVTTRSVIGHKVGAGCKDYDPIARCAGYLRQSGFDPTITKCTDGLYRLSLSSEAAYEFMTSIKLRTKAQWAGFLGGIYDAEGSGKTFAQFKSINPITYALIEKGLRKFGFRIHSTPKSIFMGGGRDELFRFWSIASPCLTRKLRDYLFNAGGKFMSKSSAVKSISPMRGEHDVFTLTTTTGNYVAYGCGSKNCDAKQTSFGFDAKGASNLDELQDKLRETVMVRRLKEEVLTELPPKTRQLLTLPSTGAENQIAAEMDAYTNCKERIAELRAKFELAKASPVDGDYKAAIAGLKAGVAEAFQVMARARKAVAIAKLPVMIDHVQEAVDEGGKVIFFCHHREVHDAMTHHFGDQAVGIIGGDSIANRQVAVDRFQKDEKVRVFVGSIGAAGVGITLTASSHVVMGELSWVPGDMVQAEDRAHRISQKSNVLSQWIVLEGSLDSRMAQTLMDKAAIIDAALDDLREGERPEITPQQAIVDKLRVFEDEEAATKQASRDRISREAEHITPADILVVHDALRFLAAMDADGARARNNAGFARIDSRIGRELARLSGLEPRQAALGLRIVKKYAQTQLPDMAADISEIWDRVTSHA